MYRTYRQTLFTRIEAVLRDKFQVELPRLTVPRLSVEEPPKVEMGDYALPLAFELARTLRKAPRKIAEEIVAAIGPVQGFTGFEVAGAGYINCRLDRAAAAKQIAAAPELLPSIKDHVLVEHTSINPNKAAHIGHLRNAILGDTLVRMLRAANYDVGVENYIDNTGVQVADVVIGLFGQNDLLGDLPIFDISPVGNSAEEILKADFAAEKRRQVLEEVTKQTENPKVRFDFFCWTIYTSISLQYEQARDEAYKETYRKIRRDALHAIEQGGNQIAAIADLVSTAVLRRHLETMLRLGIEYDFLPRESEILHLKFWDAAFTLLKQSGILYLETEGKNTGCWVMRRAGTAENIETADSTEPDEDAKIIVRSNGTVTYVGKDIAYHLWKFNKLGLDFGYHLFHVYPNGHRCWISAIASDDPASDLPSFGHANAIYNVIDSRQADPQNNVIEALRGMGFTEAADNYHHFSYEMVALTPRCAMDLGYIVSDEDQGRAYIEVSGRKGFGVKADDLIDKLIESALVQVTARQPERNEAERLSIAGKIAVGALRYYMLRYTRNTVIAFDFQDALSFEGETGPYVQYAVVRATNIFRKAGVTPEEALHQFENIDAAAYFSGEGGDSLWELWLLASKSVHVLERAIQTTEPSYLAKYAFYLAQQFSNFYHRHHILTESDPTRKTLLLATAAVAQRELIRALGWMGIEAPDVM